MKFIDNEHKKFFFDKWEQAKEQGKTDVYYKSLIYTLSMCETTREHFNEIFNLNNGEVNLNSIQKGWQTSTSLKVTRMALNLWKHSIVYDSEADIENEQISSHYAPSEIFCCSYAPYFWEGIKIRYPEYTNYEKNNKIPRAAIYMRVGNIEQLEYYVEEKINNKLQNKVAGLYIRVGCDNDAGMRYIYTFRQSPNIISISIGIALYILLLFPYIIQSRNTKSTYRILGSERSPHASKRNKNISKRKTKYREEDDITININNDNYHPNSGDYDSFTM